MRDYKTLTSLEWSRLVEYYKTHSAKKTADHFNVVCNPAFAAKLVQSHNKRGIRKEYTKEEVGRVVSLYLDGVSFKEIQASLNMTYSQVFHIIQSRRPGKRQKHLAKKGERHNVSRFSDEQIIEMLTAIEDGWATKDVAKNFSTSPVYVREIIRGKSRTDNPKINEIRDRILKDEKKAVKPLKNKHKKANLHTSAFNNESGQPIIEK